VVLDLLMPRLGGLDALKRIHAFDPRILVVAVTGQPDPELRSRALAVGATALLTKPVGLVELAAILEGPTRPVVDERSERASVQAAPAAPVAGRVLVVDDDPEIHALLEEFLARHGYATRSVLDGAAAVRAVLDDAPDVVLLDITMPRLGGLEALAALRAIAPAVQVIMLSGQTDVELAKRTLSFGAFDYVTKPVDFAHLAESVGAAITMTRVSGSIEGDSRR
jgi:DNA-binding response OmpR family regulator